jgi:hypothetical protein
MAGRPLGLRSLMKALSRYSRAQLEKLIAAVPTQSDVVAKLERRREKLAKAMTKLDRQIAKLSGGNGSVAAPARRGRKPGRKKGYTLSAATRRKMSEAAKRRYAGGAKSEAPAAAGKRTRKPFSAETRAKMAAAQKARWAKAKKTGHPS